MTAHPHAPAGWATRAYVAARARLVTEHRPLDPQWIADYQAEVAAICAQSGLDPQGPLELTLVGLAAAPSEQEPFTSPARGAGGPEAPRASGYIPPACERQPAGAGRRARVTRCRCEKPRETYDLGWYVWGCTPLRTPRWLDETCCGPAYRFWCWARSVGLIQIRPRTWWEDAA